MILCDGSQQTKCARTYVPEWAVGGGPHAQGLCVYMCLSELLLEAVYICA